MRAGIAELERFQEGLAGGCGDASADMQALEEMFARASQLDAEVEAQEARIAAVFAFLMEAFGDAQEMLIFVTELTQRTPSAERILFRPQPADDPLRCPQAPPQFGRGSGVVSKDREGMR